MQHDPGGGGDPAKKMNAPLYLSMIFDLPRVDDDRIVSHDASRLGLYYHCVRDVIIYFTLSG